jgi:AbiJ-like protein
MAKFSERYGYASVRTVLQVDDIDDSLRNKLWNVTRT